MYVVAVKFKGEEKSVLNGPFEAHNLAEQAVVNLVGRSDVEAASIIDDEDIEEKDENS